MMISGARELMTPGAWKKVGVLVGRIADKAHAVVPASDLPELMSDPGRAAVALAQAQVGP